MSIKSLVQHFYGVCGVAIVVLALASSSINFASAQSVASTTSDSSNDTSTSTDSSNDVDGMISESDALEFAEEAYTGSGSYASVEQRNEDDRPVYAIWYTESDGGMTEVTIDAMTGALLAVTEEEDSNDEDDANGTTTATTAISVSEAREIADDAYTGNGTYSDTEERTENGTQVYAVWYEEDNGHETEVVINATTGTVLDIVEHENNDSDNGGNNGDDDGEAFSREEQITTLLRLIGQLVNMLDELYQAT